MVRGVSLAEFVRAGVPRVAAHALRQEARTLDLFQRRGRLSRAAGLKAIERLARRLARGFGT